MRFRQHAAAVHETTVHVQEGVDIVVGDLLVAIDDLLVQVENRREHQRLNRRRGLVTIGIVHRHFLPDQSIFLTNSLVARTNAALKTRVERLNIVDRTSFAARNSRKR